MFKLNKFIERSKNSKA